MARQKPARTTAQERPTKRARVEEKQKNRINWSPHPTTERNKKGKQKEVTIDTDDTPPKTSKSQSKTLPSTFKIVAGSYEKLLYGLQGSVTLSSSDAPSTSRTPHLYTFHLSPIFIFPAHVSCIKAVAASPEGGKWLATGSADEIIKVWDLRRRKEIGGLMHHQGSVTHLTFPSRSHLLSASEDGTLCLFHARDWSVLRVLKGHKGRVNSVAVHPSGKVALSVGKDKTLRMWDLMRGKGCASTKLGKEGEIVRWSTDGSLFVVQSGSTMDLYTTDMTLVHTITHPSRLHDVCFCKRMTDDGELLLTAAEDKRLSVYDVSSDPEKVPKIVAAMVGHDNRVKAVQTLNIALPAPSPSTSTTLPKSTTVICTASSDGKIHIYDLARVGIEGVVEIGPEAVYDSKGTRLTCVALADGDPTDGASKALVNGKRKRDGDEEDEEEDDDAEGEDEDEDAVESEVEGGEEEDESELEDEEEEEEESD